MAVPQLAPCASSGRRWRPLAARHSQREAQPLDTQPPPRVLVRAASEVADFTAFGRVGTAPGSSRLWAMARRTRCTRVARTRRAPAAKAPAALGTQRTQATYPTPYARKPPLVHILALSSDAHRQHPVSLTFWATLTRNLICVCPRSAKKPADLSRHSHSRGEARGRRRRARRYGMVKVPTLAAPQLGVLHLLRACLVAPCS